MINKKQKILELFEKSGPRLHGLLAKLTLDENAVGDLLQELFLRLWKSKAFDKARDPFAYAYRVTINLAFEWRKNRKNSYKPLEGNCPAQMESSALGNPLRDPLRGMIADEELQQVLDATMQLSDLSREVVVMRYIEQQSYEEISKRLGKKPQYLRALNAKAITRLRKLLINKKIIL